MKAVLEFDLNDSDDIISHKRCVQSIDLCLALWEFLYNTRKGIERELDEDDTADKYSAVEKTYSKLYDILQDHNVNIDSLVV